jgi:r-opsin
VAWVSSGSRGLGSTQIHRFFVPRILGFTIALFSVIALLGNLCVIYIFAKTKSLRTPSNLFVINLALSDFMIMFTMGPPMVVNCYYETWIFGPLMCQLVG